MINYALQNSRINKEYLVNYTNAAFVVKEGFKLPEDGLYSGFDAEKQTYDKSTWNYEEGGDLTGKAAAAMPAPGHRPRSHLPRRVQRRQRLPSRVRLRLRRCCRPTWPTTSRWSTRAAFTSS